MFKLKKLVIRVNKYSTNPIKIFEFTNQGFPGETDLIDLQHTISQHIKKSRSMSHIHDN